jgi:predicted amidohydrolase YtcJ
MVPVSPAARRSRGSRTTLGLDGQRSIIINDSPQADLVILDGDPTTVPTDDILDIAVLETFKEGRSVYRA